MWEGFLKANKIIFWSSNAIPDMPASRCHADSGHCGRC
jgi:hypothetical protein